MPLSEQEEATLWDQLLHCGVASPASLCDDALRGDDVECLRDGVPVWWLPIAAEVAPGDEDMRQSQMRHNLVVALHKHAVTLRNTAFVLEPTTTKELQRAIGATDAGGRLETKLVKDVLSITRELMYESCGQPHLKSLQEVSQQRMADVISYTIVFERAQYSTATESLQRALEEKYVLLACHNFWPKGNTHHGIKSSFYVGHGLMPFEVQIHTPESFATDKSAAPCYEIRLLDNDAHHIYMIDNAMAEAAASIPRPDAPETLLAIGDQRSTVPTEPPGHREWCTENETLWREQNDLSTLQHHSADASRVAVIDKETRSCCCGSRHRKTRREGRPKKTPGLSAKPQTSTFEVEDFSAKPQTSTFEMEEGEFRNPLSIRSPSVAERLRNTISPRSRGDLYSPVPKYL